MRKLSHAFRPPRRVCCDVGGPNFTDLANGTSGFQRNAIEPTVFADHGISPRRSEETTGSTNRSPSRDLRTFRPANCHTTTLTVSFCLLHNFDWKRAEASVRCIRTVRGGNRLPRNNRPLGRSASRRDHSRCQLGTPATVLTGGFFFFFF